MPADSSPSEPPGMLQEYWSVQPLPSPGDFPDSGIKSRSLAFQAVSEKVDDWRPSQCCLTQMQSNHMGWVLIVFLPFFDCTFHLSFDLFKPLYLHHHSIFTLTESILTVRFCIVSFFSSQIQMWIDRQKDRQRHRQVDRQTDRQIDVLQVWDIVLARWSMSSHFILFL